MSVKAWFQKLASELPLIWDLAQNSARLYFCLL